MGERIICVKIGGSLGGEVGVGGRCDWREGLRLDFWVLNVRLIGVSDY